MTEFSDRLREHPVERFDGDCHLFDFRTALNELRAERHDGQGGHRQKTIFHRAPVTYVLFDFEAGGDFPEHAANGLITMQVLQGSILVREEEGTHDLATGTMLVLAPNVRHSIHANQPAAMLLTVHMAK